MQGSTQNLLSLLGRIRRRVLLILVASYASVAMVYAMLGGVILTVLLPVRLDLSLVWLMSVVSAMILCVAMCAAVRRCPSLRTVASLVDRIYHLQQRLETALEYLQQQDAVTLLLLQDAWRHLPAVEPARIWPFKMGMRGRVIAVYVLACLGVALSVRYIMQPGGPVHVAALLPWRHGKMPGGLPEIALQSKDSVIEESAQFNVHLSPPGASEVDPTALHASPAAPGHTAVQQPHQTGRSQAGLDPLRTRTAGATESSEDFPVSRVTALAAETEAFPTRELATFQQHQESTLGRHGSADTTGQQATSRSSTSPGARAESSAPATSRYGDTRGGTAHTSSSRTREKTVATAMPNVSQPVPAAISEGGQGVSLMLPASGVDAETPAHGTSSDASTGLAATLSSGVAHDVVNLAPSRQTYQRAWDAAEAVLRRERIPPGLRQYVHDYFIAIHP